MAKLSSYQTDPTTESNHKLWRKYEKKLPKATRRSRKIPESTFERREQHGIHFPFYSFTISMEAGYNQWYVEWKAFLNKLLKKPEDRVWGNNSYW